eukprot:scaffold49877_cov66-Phaeocystis_antarctica.AAC.3
MLPLIPISAAAAADHLPQLHPRAPLPGPPAAAWRAVGPSPAAAAARSAPEAASSECAFGDSAPAAACCAPVAASSVPPPAPPPPPPSTGTPRSGTPPRAPPAPPPLLTSRSRLQTLRRWRAAAGRRAGARPSRRAS